MALTGVTAAVRDARRESQRATVRYRVEQREARAKAIKQRGDVARSAYKAAGKASSRSSSYTKHPSTRQPSASARPRPTDKYYKSIKNPTKYQTAWQWSGMGSGKTKVQVFYYNGGWHVNRRNRTYASPPRPRPQGVIQPISGGGISPRPIKATWEARPMPGVTPRPEMITATNITKPTATNVVYKTYDKAPSNYLPKGFDEKFQATKGSGRPDPRIRSSGLPSVRAKRLSNLGLTQGKITRVGIVNVSKLPPSPHRTGPSVTVPIGRLPGYKKEKRKANRGKGKRRRTVTKSQPPTNVLYGSIRGRPVRGILGSRIKL